MTAVAEELKAKLANLSHQEQAELAHFLIHRLDDVGSDEAYDEGYEAAWAAELERRQEDVDSGREQGEDASY